MNIIKEKTLCFTGHRPGKIFGYNPKESVPMLNELKKHIIYMIEHKGIENFITGMALGIDMWAARIVLNLKKQYPQIKLICAIPCSRQWSRWATESIEEWENICSKADFVHLVSSEPYTAWCMQIRNKWMVDNSSVTLAVWDGSEGGTGNCVIYAFKKDVEIYQLHPKTLDFKQIK